MGCEKDAARPGFGVWRGLRRVARLPCNVVTGRARREVAGLRRSRRPARVKSGGLACFGYGARGEAVSVHGALRLGCARAGAIDARRPGTSRPSKRRWGEQRSIPRPPPAAGSAYPSWAGRPESRARSSRPIPGQGRDPQVSRRETLEKAVNASSITEQSFVWKGFNAAAPGSFTFLQQNPNHPGCGAGYFHHRPRVRTRRTQRSSSRLARARRVS